jgi:hypothetical protein
MRNRRTSRRDRFPDPVEGPIDSGGLAEVVGKLQGLARRETRALERIARNWRFLILAVELGEGTGSAYGTNSPERGEIIAAARRQGRRLSGDDKGPGIHIGTGPGRISARRAERLVRYARIAGGRIAHAMPQGWGFALLIYPAEGKSGIYVANCERGAMALTLLEAAERWGRHEDRPPGRLGKDS